MEENHNIYIAARRKRILDPTRIMSIIETIADARPDAPAIIDANGQILNYAQLNRYVFEFTEFLKSRGIKKDQRIAVVCPQCITMTMTCLSVSNVASFVPLSPNNSEQQYRYYFEILKTDSLIIPYDYNVQIQRIAEEMKMNIFYLYEQTRNLELICRISGGEPVIENSNNGYANEEDTAMVLFTSGTTSVPKIVPLSHKNSYYSALKTLKVMNLNSEDRMMITFPIYRGITIHDILSILYAGGCAIISSEFEPGRFFDLLNKTSPTWFVGSPVLFHALTEYAEDHGLNINCESLRGIRSSGAPLSKELTAMLKNMFKVPVYIAYGTTETNNIANTKNSPQGYKAKSVGVPKDIEVRIADEQGNLLGNNNPGEIVVRGPQVLKSYDNDALVNEASYFGDWFRTGDAGYLDDDGYLFITGRFKEIINRGGEKISPYEIEDAVAQHPDVLQVAVFPVPDKKGNEDIGAAVVLRPGAKLYLKDLRRFLTGKVEVFKMPSFIYVLNKIPVGDAGKVQRKMLFEQISSQGAKPQPEAGENEEMIMPRNETEAELYNIFKKILPLKQVSINDNFFELGGNSLKAALLYNHIKNYFGIQIPLKRVFQHSSIADLALIIDNHKTTKAPHHFLVPFQEEGSKIPVFFIHATEGEPVTYRYIANNFDPERPFYSFSLNLEAGQWRHPITFAQIAEYYIKDIRTIQPEGPYILGGHCIGGIIAYEMARQLHEKKQEVKLLAMYDSIIPSTEKLERNIGEVRHNGLNYFSTKCFYYRTRFYKYLYKKSPYFIKKIVFRMMDKRIILSNARSDYKIKKYPGKIVYFKPESYLFNRAQDSIEIWSKLADEIEVILLKGDHNSIFFAENAENTKAILLDLLADIP